MKIKYITILKLLICVAIFFACGATTKVQAGEAENISSKVEIMCNNSKITKLSDNSTDSKVNFVANLQMKITAQQTIGSIYIKYENSAKPGTLTTNGKQYKLGENGFLHEYVSLETTDAQITTSENTATQVTEILISYDEPVTISEIYCFSQGDVPSWVQKWKIQEKDVDLMLFSTHSDDEQLFFAGLLPKHVAEGYNVQVVYLTNHNNTPTRLHEQLDGLWTVGITNYPIIGEFPDAYSENLENAIKNLEKSNYTLDSVIEFQVAQLRKYKPLVVVGHDENGEYNHGQHILNTYALKQAIEKSNDTNYSTTTEELYGIWQTPKVYLHLYSDNQITLDYDIPLEYFDGKTAYEVSKLGYACHKSQQYTWFTKWLKGPNNTYTKATEIQKYNPTQFGLYFSTVGKDIEKNNMFENINKSEFRIQEEIVQNEDENTNLQQKDTNNTGSRSRMIMCVIIVGITIAVVIIVCYYVIKKRN